MCSANIFTHISRWGHSAVRNLTSIHFPPVDCFRGNCGKAFKVSTVVPEWTSSLPRRHAMPAIWTCHMSARQSRHVNGGLCRCFHAIASEQESDRCDNSQARNHRASAIVLMRLRCWIHCATYSSRRVPLNYLKGRPSLHKSRIPNFVRIPWKVDWRIRWRWFDGSDGFMWHAAWFCIPEG